MNSRFARYRCGAGMGASPPASLLLLKFPLFFVFLKTKKRGNGGQVMDKKGFR